MLSENTIDPDKVMAKPAPNVPFFIPRQPLTPGISRLHKQDENQKENDKLETPLLFQPLTILPNFTIPNRIGVSPMCLYSADPKDGKVTPFHLTHYNGFAIRGVGLTILESVSVTKNGRTTPNDLGLFKDHDIKDEHDRDSKYMEQIEGLKQICDFYHSQQGSESKERQLIGIQLSHGGIKSSQLPLYFGYGDHPIDESRGGWLNDVHGISLTSRNRKMFPYAKTMTTAEVWQVIDEFDRAIQDSICKCGFDFIEIHAAHGYLINQFMSPATNDGSRKDEFGNGTFESRIKILLEILKKIQNFKKLSNLEFPVFVRISASDNDESSEDGETWKLKDSLKLAPILVDYGVDVINVSSGGNVAPTKPRIPQWEMAKQIKAAIVAHSQNNTEKLSHHSTSTPTTTPTSINSRPGRGLVAAVGRIHEGETANKYLEEQVCDICLSGTGFLKNPNQVEKWADELKSDVQMNMQVGWVFHKVW
ncbi:unnamed protein product [Ambrosiozyma monospora]|uniref:Unnamed protein product n=1 Tax=Ambrosiozyma monospora TaxID=43982 RepID=A0A9W7DI57_AMBMO|nr:unnamed protein product [Ambrosiozyma monospora]